MISLTATTTEAPHVDALRHAALTQHPFPRSADVVVPVLGMSGDVHGALVIVGGGVVWDDTTRRLVRSFAHHLGSALGLSRLRKDLASAAERRKRRRSMVRRGIDILRICPSCQRCYDQHAERCLDDGAALKMPRPFPIAWRGGIA